MERIEVPYEGRALIKSCLIAFGGEKTARFSGIHHSILYKIADQKQKRLSEKNWRKLIRFAEFINSNYIEDLID
jgi:hypothetical protein